jgi:hypothetical protein
VWNWDVDCKNHKTYRQQRWIFFHGVARYMSTDHECNIEIRKKLQVLSLNIKMQNYINNWLQHLKRIEYLTRFGSIIHKQTEILEDQWRHGQTWFRSQNRSIESIPRSWWQWIIFGMEHKLWRSSLCYCPHPPATFSVLGPDILPSTLFSDVLSLWSFLMVRNQISHSYETVLYIWTLSMHVISVL